MEVTALYSPYRGFWSNENGWVRQVSAADAFSKNYNMILGFRSHIPVYRVVIDACDYIIAKTPDNYLRDKLTAKQWERYRRLYQRASAPTPAQIERAVHQTGDWFALQCDTGKGFFMIKRTPKDCLQKGGI